MKGTEAISDLFHFELELLSLQDAIDFKSIIGQNATLALRLQDESERYFSGLISRFSQGQADDVFVHYRAELVPWPWFLTLKQNCRIFQNKSVPDILKAMFDDFGFGEYELDLKGSYDPRTYCVQYRETDYDFVCRLMQEEGMHFFFQHAEDHHKLMVVDDPAGNPECPLRSQLDHSRTDETPDRLLDWQVSQVMHPGQYSMADFNFETPSVNLGVTTQTTHSIGANSALEIYDYPGNYGSIGQGESRAKLRMQAREANALSVRGASSLRTLISGHRLSLTGHYRREWNKDYLLTSVSHSVAQGTGREGTSDITYENHFTCIPHDLPYRPLLSVPRPVIQGAQTAIVVGRAGEEIDVDEHGRVKVQFHWDREGKRDENSSCWIRVGQGLAGKRWGAVFIPRIGQEVLVEFLEGDPDRPIITVVVYNVEAKPPYDLPGQKTKSTLKTNSSKGGEGFNEIRIEDKKGEEQIFIHGQKNLDLRVKNDSFETVEHNRHVSVENDSFLKVAKNLQETVAQDRVIGVDRDLHLKIGGKQASEVTGSFSLSVQGDVIEVFKANHSRQVTGNLYLKGMGLVIEGATGITLKAGAGSVVIDGAGVTLSGPTVTVDGGMVKIASGPGSPAQAGTAGSLVAPQAVEQAEDADLADPGKVDDLKIQQQEAKTGKYGAPKVMPFVASQQAEDEDKTWIEIELVDEEGNPIPGEKYEVTVPDGRVASGTLDEKGLAKVTNIDPGECKVTFPDLDKAAWQKG
jgi:type VI secretion system secreted protein VgrG